MDDSSLRRLNAFAHGSYRVSLQLERQAVQRELERYGMKSIWVAHALEELGWTILATYTDHAGKRRRIVILRERRMDERTLTKAVERELLTRSSGLIG
jgi:hypothetical protein